jgi:hypothetical protein
MSLLNAATFSGSMAADCSIAKIEREPRFYITSLVWLAC